MLTLSKTIALGLLACLLTLAQGGLLHTDSQTISASGASITVANQYSSQVAGFLETVLGSPTSTTVVISGCTSLNVCTQLDSNATTGSSVASRKPTIASVYDHYSISATWSGGAGVLVTIRTEISGPNPSQVTGAVSVENSGARCDGVTDDTTAITTAIAAGGVITFPPRTCHTNPATFIDYTGKIIQAYGTTLDGRYGTQIVTFTNNSTGVAALGTITVSGNVPTGAVTITNNGGTLYSASPTAGTIATCTGAGVFTGGAVTVDALGDIVATVEVL